MSKISQRERNPDEREANEDQTTDERQQPRETCPECDGHLVQDEKHAETACSECGYVVSSGEIDHGPDWRSLSEDGGWGESRAGSPRTKMLHDEGVSSQIDWRNKDGYGNPLSTKRRKQMDRLRTWHNRVQTEGSGDRNLKKALSEIDRMASALGLPETVRETASVVYRRALSEDLLRGRSIESISTASIYVAARQASLPRTLDEITAVSRIERLPITRAYRYITRELNLEIAPPSPLDYLPRLISELDLTEDAEFESRNILTTTAEEHESYLGGKNPVGLAAAAVYAGSLLANDKVTQEEVSEVADITEVTIRNRYQELMELGSDMKAF